MLAKAKHPGSMTTAFDFTCQEKVIQKPIHQIFLFESLKLLAPRPALLPQ